MNPKDLHYLSIIKDALEMANCLEEIRSGKSQFSSELFRKIGHALRVSDNLERSIGKSIRLGKLFEQALEAIKQSQAASIAWMLDSKEPSNWEQHWEQAEKAIVLLNEFMDKYRAFLAEG